VAREDLFSKLNIKDYNNKLEDVLENKSFSESTKNILLNILYKMENAYDDYKKVKVNVGLKKELLERIITIIEKDCKEIEIVKPKLNEETKLGDKVYIVNKKDGKIISYPNEKKLFYALNHLANNRYVLNDKYILLKEPMEKLLNQGYISENEELIRDFDGWTWNISKEEIENFTYNLVYQNIRILLGNRFLDTNHDDLRNKDYITFLEDEIKRISEKEYKNILTLIYKISILENMKDDENKKKNTLRLKEDIKEELIKMENKNEYLQEFANSKKVIGKHIKQIDESLNNNKLLRAAFIKRNEELKDDEKIFSLSEFAELLQSERRSLLKQLEYCSFSMKPMNFVKKKEEVSKRNSILSKIDFDVNYRHEIYNELINLQKSFLKVLNKKIKDIEIKKEIVNYIYLFRYYKLIYINSNTQIKDLNELKEELRKTEKHLITKACKMKAVNILCQDIEKNYELVSEILSYNIIELEDVSLEFKKHDKNIVVTIYDEDTIEDSIIYDGNEELSVKYNRKMKLFI